MNLMYLRFENDTLAEASPVTYRTAKYTWYPAPAGYDPTNVYLLENGAVVQATVAQKVAANLVAYQARTLEKALDLADIKRLAVYPFRPGKEREYIFKQSIAKSYSGDITTDPIGMALLTDEAAERGLTVDELVVLIKSTIETQVSLLGSIAGLSAGCKIIINNAVSHNDVDAAYYNLGNALDALI
jgi:hypothetical protein